MPRVSQAFFLLAALCGVVGMMWGMVMGATQDFATHPAHAHLNLVGWVSLAIMGTFYALNPVAAAGRVAWANFCLSALGAVILPWGIARIMLGGDGEGLAVAGGSLAFLGMLLFLFNVAIGALGRRRG
jgi:hypothetical protein